MKLLLLKISCLTLLTGSYLNAVTIPAWWTIADENGNKVLVDGVASDDYTLANQGQAKFMAKRAIEHLDESVGAIGGASFDFTTLVNTSASSDYSPLNQGQLKQLAFRFYDRLNEIGFDDFPSGMQLYSNGYPWDPSQSAEDYAVVNQGQLKYLFSWDLTNWILQNQDTDDYPDWWELYYFDGLDIIQDLEDDYDLDGLADGDEFALGMSPVEPDFDNDFIPDGAEVLLGWDPKTADTFPFETVDFTDDFDSYALGNFSPSGNWLVNGNVVVVEGDAEQGQVLSLDNNSTLEHLFSSDEASEIWIDFEIKPVALNSNLPPEISSTSACGFFVDTNGFLNVYDGQASGGNGAWQVLSLVTIPQDSWNRFTIHLDYTTQTWSLWLNQLPVASGLGFANNVPYFYRFHMMHWGSVATQLDAVSITKSAPTDLSLLAHFDYIFNDVSQLTQLGTVSTGEALIGVLTGYHNRGEFDTPRIGYLKWFSPGPAPVPDNFRTFASQHPDALWVFGAPAVSDVRYSGMQATIHGDETHAVGNKSKLLSMLGAVDSGDISEIVIPALSNDDEFYVDSNFKLTSNLVFTINGVLSRPKNAVNQYIKAEHIEHLMLRGEGIIKGNSHVDNERVGDGGIFTTDTDYFSVLDLDIEHFPAFLFNIRGGNFLTLRGLSLDNTSGSVKPLQTSNTNWVISGVNQDGFHFNSSSNVLVTESDSESVDDSFAYTVQPGYGIAGKNLIVTDSNFKNSAADAAASPIPTSSTQLDPGTLRRAIAGIRITDEGGGVPGPHLENAIFADNIVTGGAGIRVGTTGAVLPAGDEPIRNVLLADLEISETMRNAEIESVLGCLTPAEVAQITLDQPRMTIGTANSIFLKSSYKVKVENVVIEKVAVPGVWIDASNDIEVNNVSINCVKNFSNGMIRRFEGQGSTTEEVDYLTTGSQSADKVRRLGVYVKANQGDATNIRLSDITISGVPNGGGMFIQKFEGKTIDVEVNGIELYNIQDASNGGSNLILNPLAVWMIENGVVSNAVADTGETADIDLPGVSITGISFPASNPFPEGCSDNCN